MRSITKHMGRILSVLLVTAMLVTSVPQSVLTAAAAELPRADQISAKETAPAEILPGEPASEDRPADETAPTETAPESSTPDDNLTEATSPVEVPPEGSGSESATPEEDDPESTTPEEDDPESTTPEENNPENTTPEGNSSEDTTLDENNPEDTTPEEDGVPPKTEPGAETPEESVPADTVQEETVSENTSESNFASNEQEAEPAADGQSIIAKGPGPDGSTVTWTLYQDGSLVVEGTGEILMESSSSYRYLSPWADHTDKILSATVRVKGATNAANLFRSCSHMKTVDLSEFDTSNITDMSGMFFGCESLAEIDVSNFHTGNVKQMDHMFSSCRSLSKLDLSSFDTSSVISTINFVDYCESLTEINLSSFDTSNTRFLNQMFANCSSLESIDLSSFVINSKVGIGSVNVDGMFENDNNLKRVVTPKQLAAGVRISLPKTDGSCSWRTSDGTKILSIGHSSAQEYEGGMTISTDTHVGISFGGDHFKLEEYPDTNLADIEKVFRKGSKDSFTFTIVPDAGYTVTPTVVPKLAFSKITVTQGDSPYQYVVTPKDPEQGYVQDEVINITVAKPAVNLLDVNYQSQIADCFFVADGKKVAENMSAELSADNEADITAYVKLEEPQSDVRIVPAVELVSGFNNSNKKRIKSAESLTAEEQEFAKGGYAVVRLGQIYEKVTVNVIGIDIYYAKISTSGFPENVQVIQFVADDFGRYEERVCGEELMLDAGEPLYLQPRWNDEKNEHKWCSLSSIRTRLDGTFVVGLNFTQMTLPGVSGEVLSINQVYGTNEKLSFSLVPHEIRLYYGTGEISDITLSEGAQLSETGHTIYVHSGDSLSVSFTVGEGLTMKGVTVQNGYNINVPSEELTTVTDEGAGRWTAVINDLSSRIPDIGQLSIDVEDPLHRPSLSDPRNQVDVNLYFSKAKPATYRNEPIIPNRVSVTLKYPSPGSPNIYHGHIIMHLGSDDYTLTYANNINAGTATVTVKARPESRFCWGQYVKSFTISKASAPNIPETHFYVEASEPQTDLSELVINGAYDQNVKPAGFTVLNSNNNGVLASKPVIDGTIMSYSIREGASIKSIPATIYLEVSFDNYQSSQFLVYVHLVERANLVLGGNLVSDKVYDGMEFVPNLEGLQVVSKEGAAPGAEETAAIRDSIKDTMSYRYTGTEGTVYDSETPPVNVGTYKLQAKVSRDNTLYKSDWMDAGTFQITKREAVFAAKDVTRYVNDTIPASNEYNYTVEGLVTGDTVNGAPVLTSDIQSTEKVGNYPIHVAPTDTAGKLLVQVVNAAGTDVTANYHITGKEGVLHIEEPKQGSCTVIYSLSGKGANIRRSGFAAGSLLPKPADPVVKGFKFLGWYLDETLARTWDFAADTIQGDITLYAGWSQDLSADPDNGMQIYVQEIRPQIYTGKALKPAVTVYAADGKTVLKNNKDYRVTYKNNTDADTKKFSGQSTIPDGGIGSGESDTSKGFDSRLAYAVITGKGNYTGTVYMNFHISPVDLSGALNPASGITLKYTESFEEKSGKTAAIVTQLKTRTAKLKYGTDYTLAVQKAADGSAVTLSDKGQLPLNSGTYRLTITGKDNYAGSIEKELYVADRSHLIKNAKVTCTGTIADVGKEQLTAGVEAQNLQVSMAGDLLTENTNYTVSYSGNKAIGTATVTVKGINGYFGSKSVTYKIKGTAFKEKEFGTVALQDMDYTGEALTQNDVVLSKNGTPLVYGEDYTISYKNNIKAGKASMTFMAKPSSGYSGSFKKTFKINPLNLDSPGILLQGIRKNSSDSRLTLEGSVPYQKGGATPSDKLKLQLSKTGAFLTAGKDYTIKYKDNKEISEVSEGEACMTLTGRGNFAGSLTVYFDIQKASLSELYQAGIISITSKPARVTFSYRSSREEPDDEPEDVLIDPDHEFKPAVTVKHGKQALKQGVDYEVDYSGNSRAALEGGGLPDASITGIGNYAGLLTESEKPITIPLCIYQYSLSAATVYVVYDEIIDPDTGEPIFYYTGGQICPKVKAVYYGKAADIRKAKRDQVTDESILTAEKPQPDTDSSDLDPEDLDSEDSNPAYGLTKLQEFKNGKGDYILSYGANTAKGKTGKVIVSGIHNYGGKASITFTISPKNIYTFFSQDE